MEEKADVLESSQNLAKIDEDSLLNKTGNDSAIACSGKNPVFRGQEYDTRTRKSIRRSFDLIKESPSRKLVHKTKSFSSYFLVNIDELRNRVSARSFDESGTFLNNTDTNKELDFLPRYESSFPTERSKDATRVRNLESEDEEEPDSCSWKKMQNGPALGIYLKFEDVNYKVQFKGKKNSNVEKYILQGVNGSVCTGEILALVGPSGSGKTTLLNLLSGRMKNHGGTITYNDQLYTKSLKRRIGFVLQDDIVFPHLTVKETLTYSALLRLPNTLSRDQKKERAMTVISELGLERCQDTMIGGTSVRGVSGGERKRVCIGNEILINPSLLFLDEPTSCLDSTTALRIIQMLHNIARDGKTVVTTIHQPSSRLFSKFDKLILLSEGSSLYFGKASEAMLHFSSIGCSPLISMNPAEFLIDLANGNMKDKSIPPELEDNFLSFDRKNRGLSPGVVHEYLLGAYESRAHKTGKIQFLNASKVERQNMCTNGKQWGATWSEQFSILFERGLKERRHEYLSSLRIIQVISTSIIIGLLWWQSDHASSSKMVQDQAGLLFFISAFWTFFPLFTAIFTFPQEREMLAKERSVDMYKLSAYLIARNTSDLPLDLLLPILFLVIVYFMAGLKLTFSAFSLTSITIFLSIIASQGLGLAIGAAFTDVKKATTLASFTVMTFMLLGGFFIKKVPRFISWIRYTSLNYHTYRLLLKIQYNCHKGSSGSAICDSPFIKAQRLDHGGTEVGAVLIMIIGYRILVYILLRRMKLMNVTS